MQSFTCMCLLVPLLLFFHLTQVSDTADHGGAATDVRSADRTLKRFPHDFRRAPKRRSDGHYDRNRKTSVQLDTELLVEGVREGQEERAEASYEKLLEIGR
uniref:Conantokin-L-like conotoxin n=2 Tax=Conus TaxID=6490 RepID=F5C3U0_CONEB|nr:Eb-conantokin-like protein [Conus eburneus]ADZ99323.1 conantokin-L-like conotoxin [Conus eburneus]QFQ60981.1 conotoxin superfamily conantokin [Conus magus]